MGIAVAAILAAAVAPIAYPAFPANLAYSTVARWAQRQTDIAPEDLVDVQEGFAFAALPAWSRHGPRPVRMEAVDARAWKRLGGRSAELRVDLSCKPLRATPMRLDVYPAANRLGQARRVDPGVLQLSQATLLALAADLCTPQIQARPLIEPPVEPPIAASPAPPAPRRPAGLAVQVGTYASRAAAARALTALRRANRLALAGKTIRLEPNPAGTRAGWRALFTGFDGAREAEQFCRAIARNHHQCLVREVR